MSNSDVGVVQYSDGDAEVTVLKGAVHARLVHHPGRAFCIDIWLDLVKGARFFDKKPPMHFHIQEEHVEVTQGELVADLDGTIIILTPSKGRFTIKPWVHHRLYPLELHQQSGGDSTVKFLLSGPKTDNKMELSAVFFENWYKYQDTIAVDGDPVDLIQVLSTFDASGTYISLPWWVPFGKLLSIGLGVVVGRWIGSGLLNYQPFYREWTTDWESACLQMEGSIFHRRFADPSKTA
ncbi:hypothetical protein B0I35DRAFT_425862 [Stachybotrys elegans]|uniref:Uncharacterized protein n=1 Tax=Stachybotrys elegans TaxID=80388 RepID=A0A8K0ST73_9HYPO|nr:hypothetical protein B0I35DRAFT_425862 [Stachybotrys elegans]